MWPGRVIFERGVFNDILLGYIVSSPSSCLPSLLEQTTNTKKKKKKWTPIDPSAQEKPYLKAFQHFVINPECWRSERQLHREGSPLRGDPHPDAPTHPLAAVTPQFQAFIVFSPLPLSLPFFLTAGTNFIHTPREPGAQLRFLDAASCASAQSAQDGGRLDPPARAPAWVFVRPGWMGDGWNGWTDRLSNRRDGQTVKQKGQPHGLREVGLQAWAGGTLWDGFPTVSRNSFGIVHLPPPHPPKWLWKLCDSEIPGRSVVSLCIDFTSDYDRGTTGSTESPKRQGGLWGRVCLPKVHTSSPSVSSLPRNFAGLLCQSPSPSAFCWVLGLNFLCRAVPSSSMVVALFLPLMPTQGLSPSPPVFSASLVPSLPLWLPLWVLSRSVMSHSLRTHGL